MPFSTEANERSYRETVRTLGDRGSASDEPLLDGIYPSDLQIILQKEAALRSIVNQEDVPTPSEEHLVFQIPHQSSDS